MEKTKLVSLQEAEKRLRDYYGYDREEALSYLHSSGQCFIGDTKYVLSDKDRQIANIGEENYNAIYNKRKSVKEEKMAKNNQTEKQTFSDNQKCDYFKNRINDPNLSQGQRNWAAFRLNALSGNDQTITPAPNAAQSPANCVTGQKAAYNAGLGYGAAKAGARVPVSAENKGSFRNGFKRGKKFGK